MNERTVKWETIKPYYKIFYCPECGSKVTFCNIYAGIYECPKHGVIQVYYYDTIEKVIDDDAT